MSSQGPGTLLVVQGCDVIRLLNPTALYIFTSLYLYLYIYMYRPVRPASGSFRTRPRLHGNIIFIEQLCR